MEESRKRDKRARTRKSLLRSVNLPSSPCDSVLAHLAIYGTAISLAAGKL